MRRLLAAFSLIASASLAHAGVLVTLTDGTKVTVESHWSDGDQVHLVRGGVDMIVAKSRIKSMNDDVKDPEVYRDTGPADDSDADVEPVAQPVSAPAEAKAPAPQAADPSLSGMSASDLEALHHQEAKRLRELQEKRFNAMYGGTAGAVDQQRAEDSVAQQNQRTAQVFKALQAAKRAEGDGEQPQ